MKISEIDRMRQLAGIPLKESGAPAGYHGPYGFSGPDEMSALWVESPELVDQIRKISAMGEQDELEYWGGILSPEQAQEEEDGDWSPMMTFVVTRQQVAQAMRQLEAAMDEDGFIDEDDFLDVWQETLGLA